MCKLGDKNVLRLVLLILLALYSLANFALAIGSFTAWKKAKAIAVEDDCRIVDIGCGYALWGIYPFMLAAALVNLLTSLIMFLTGIFRTKGSAMDPLYVFRGIFFTLLTLAPIIVVGWSNLNYLNANLDYDGFYIRDLQSATWNSYISTANGTDRDGLPSIYTTGVLPPQFTGMGGAFILPTLVRGSGTGFAIAMVHFTM